VSERCSSSTLPRTGFASMSPHQAAKATSSVREDRLFLLSHSAHVLRRMVR
jgi:hypothetical protein